jgi:hypothetical protein
MTRSAGDGHDGDHIEIHEMNVFDEQGGGALGTVARLMLENAEAGGWGQPATVWSVDLLPADDVFDEALPGDMLAQVFAFAPAMTCDTHPFDDIVGLDIRGEHCIGAALVTEGIATKEGGDRQVEVRVAHIVLLDGSAAAAMVFNSSDDPEPIVSADVAGRATWMLRRALGMSSCPNGQDVPDITAVFRRGLLTLVCHFLAGLDDDTGALLDSVTGSGPLDDLVTQLFEQASIVLAGKGFTDSTWEQVRIDSIRALAAHERQLRDEEQMEAGEGIAQLRHMLEWGDAELCAMFYDSSYPRAELGDAVEQVRRLLPRLGGELRKYL